MSQKLLNLEAVARGCSVKKEFLKACFRYILSYFYFSLNDSPSKKYEKWFLFHLKSSFRSRDIQIFVFPSSQLFSPVNHCFRAWSKINFKIYDVMNCLNKNSITHCVWHHEKEKRYDTETYSIDIIRNILWESHAENVHQKLVPGPFLILVNNPKQPLCARNSLKNKIFWIRFIKKP